MTPITSTPPVTDAVTTVRRFFVAWEAGDVSELADFVDANAILGPILGLLYERTVYHGRGGVAQAFAETAIRWDRLDIHVRDARREDDDTVFAVLQLACAKHGMSSDIAIAVRCRLEDGRISSVEDA